MGKNKKKYSKIAKVNTEMKGVEPMNDEDFLEEEETEKEETTMEEKKHPVKDFVVKHKTGLKMAGIGILTFAVGCLCGAAGNKTDDLGGQKWGIRRKDSSTDEIDQIEVYDDQTETVAADTTDDSTESTTIE